MSWSCLGVGLSLLAFSPGAWADPPSVVVDLQDPADDAYGPGTYSSPLDAELQGAHYDLRRFVARVEGQEMVLEVTVGETIRPPAQVNRRNYTPTAFTSGLYFQNIDIYIDTDASAKGVSNSIPGRRIAFADGRTWKRAIVLTPQPAVVASIISDALQQDARLVAVPRSLIVRGKTVVARLPLTFFGKKPSPEWGWSIHSSGSAWEGNLTVVNRLTGTASADALTMPVSTTAERWEFGGAPLGRFHPQVIDIIVPSGVSQRDVLGGYNNETGALAKVPFVYPVQPSARTVASTPASQEGGAVGSAAPVIWKVADVAGGIVTVSGNPQGLAPLKIGEVLDSNGQVVARLVVTQLLPNGILANAVENRESISRGAAVRFNLETQGVK